MQTVDLLFSQTDRH